MSAPTSTPITATSHRWSDLKTDTPMPLLERQRIIGDKAMLSRVTLKRGCLVPTHAHDNEQFACILSGKLKFQVGGSQKEIVVSAGEVLHLPSNVPHSAEALEDTVVLDVFSPPSEKTGIDRS